MPNINIGDYIQALASSQFLPHIDGFIERDEVSKYQGRASKVIMNGWYMHKPENWPPSSQISPLFVAFHINSLAKESMLSDDSLRYLKSHQPIGCRDTYTRDMLVSQGVEAYFSGCMTLTLGRKYHSAEKDDKVYFVDPCFHTHWTLVNTLSSMLFLLLHFSPISKIARKYPCNKAFVKKCMLLTTFYREYRKFFSNDTLLNAEYICQQTDYYNNTFHTDEALLDEAERLVKKYAKAKLVVTSRIHCALPCLGLETPVIFTEDEEQEDASACRFGGLRELFNIMKWKEGKLSSTLSLTDLIDSHHNVPCNKSTWQPLAAALARKCEEFIGAGNL